jgi:transcriptional regulator with XRE-family HTH domain
VRELTTFARLLRNVLDNSGLNQRDFADKCGIPQPTLSQFLTGERRPKEDRLRRVIQSLGLPETEASALREAAAQAHVPAGLRKHLKGASGANALMLAALLEQSEARQAAWAAVDRAEIMDRLEKMPLRALLEEAAKYATANRVLLDEIAQLRSRLGEDASL